jgi:Pilus biogenesis CpaD protein (pilus_cpaD)/Type II/IV secretion system protein
VRDALYGFGAHTRMIVSPYPAGPNLSAPARLSFLGLKAHVADQCGQWPRDLAVGSGAVADWSNKPYWNFGCACQTAFAAQVADPRDLVAPQGETPADTAMRVRAREEIRDIVHEIVAIKNVALSIGEQQDLIDDICNDVLGYGPLEPLLGRDDIADIMVNSATRTFIEVGGKIQLTNICFRDNAQLMNICQRIVSQVGRRVDEASPICDARLINGSRVNVIAPPLAIDGPVLTIRKFRKDKLTLDQLVRFGAISPEGGEILKIIGRVRSVSGLF